MNFFLVPKLYLGMPLSANEGKGVSQRLLTATNRGREKGSKRNNMLFSLISRELGLAEFEIKNGGRLLNLIDHLSIEGSETTAAYQAGSDLFNDVVMDRYGLAMHQPNGAEDREWPSHESTDKTLYLENKLKMNYLITNP